MNDRIIIDVSKGELDFMREALITKHINMMNYFDMCEDVDKSSDEQKWAQAPDITEEEFMDQVEAIKEEKKMFFNRSKESAPKKAPWGLKKDGTPKKRPGRPVELI